MITKTITHDAICPNCRKNAIMTFEESQSFLKSVAKDMNHFASDSYLIPSPAEPLFQSFANDFEAICKEHIEPEATVERIDNGVPICIIDDYVVLPGGNKKAALTLQTGEMTFFTLDCDKGNIATINFRQFTAGTIELSRMVVNSALRGKGIGTLLVQTAKAVARNLNARLVLFPCPPLAEQKRLQMNCQSSLDTAIQRLVVWYVKLGFVKLLPEMIDVWRADNRNKVIGIPGMMAFR